MKTPERAAALLVNGMLDRTVWRELEHEDFAKKVRDLLDAVDLDLVCVSGKWLARPRASGEEEGFDPTFRLHAVEMAMMASLYLHLRYLPYQSGEPRSNDEPSVEFEDLIRPFAGSYTKRYLEIVIGHLKNAGFCEQRDHRYYAGPYLAAIDPVTANERAKAALDTFLLRRFLRQRAAELERTDATD